jgi:hypothetical protein
MKNEAWAIAMILGAFGSTFCHPAFAQNSVGGPTKQTAVGGPVDHNSPVLPANKGGSISVSPPPHLKCPAGHCAAKGTNR